MAFAGTAPANVRVGAVLDNGELWMKDGSIQHGWQLVASEARDVSMAGDRFLFLRTDGTPFGKEGALTSPWKQLGPGGHTRIAIDHAPNRTAVINSAAQLWTNEGSLPGSGSFQVGGAIETDIADGRVATVLNNGELWTKSGSLTSNWIFQLNGATDVALTGDRIVVLLNNGELWAKQGALTDQWHRIRTGVAKLAADGTRIAAIDTDKRLYVKEGALDAPWVFEVAAAVDVELDANRIATILDNKEMWLKQGTLSAEWIFQVAGATEIALAHTMAPSPPAPAPNPTPPPSADPESVAFSTAAGAEDEFWAGPEEDGTSDDERSIDAADRASTSKWVTKCRNVGLRRKQGGGLGKTVFKTRLCWRKAISGPLPRRATYGGFADVNVEPTTLGNLYGLHIAAKTQPAVWRDDAPFPSEIVVEQSATTGITRSILGWSPRRTDLFRVRGAWDGSLQWRINDRTGWCPPPVNGSSCP